MLKNPKRNTPSPESEKKITHKSLGSRFMKRSIIRATMRVCALLLSRDPNSKLLCQAMTT